jgi:hypothetical protein
MNENRLSRALFKNNLLLSYIRWQELLERNLLISYLSATTSSAGPLTTR